MNIIKTDTARIDFLERQFGIALVSDDNGHWAVVADGFQNCVTGGPKDVSTTFFIEKKQWSASVRQAIDKAMDEFYGTRRE